MITQAEIDVAKKNFKGEIKKLPNERIILSDRRRRTYYSFTDKALQNSAVLETLKKPPSKSVREQISKNLEAGANPYRAGKTLKIKRRAIKRREGEIAINKNKQLINKTTLW